VNEAVGTWTVVASNDNDLPGALDEINKAPAGMPSPTRAFQGGQYFVTAVGSYRTQADAEAATIGVRVKMDGGRLCTEHTCPVPDSKATSRSRAWRCTLRMWIEYGRTIEILSATPLPQVRYTVPPGGTTRTHAAGWHLLRPPLRSRVLRRRGSTAVLGLLRMASLMQKETWGARGPHGVAIVALVLLVTACGRNSPVGTSRSLLSAAAGSSGSSFRPIALTDTAEGIVWLATDNAMSRSTDRGDHWGNSGPPELAAADAQGSHLVGASAESADRRPLPSCRVRETRTL